MKIYKRCYARASTRNSYVVLNSDGIVLLCLDEEDQAGYDIGTNLSSEIGDDLIEIPLDTILMYEILEEMFP